MKNNNVKFLILAFIAVFTLQVVGAYTAAPSAGPTNNNTVEPMSEGAAANAKHAGLGVKEFASGSTGIVSVSTDGRMGVNTSTPASDVRLYVNGSIKIKDLAGTGTRRICSSTAGSSNEGYPLVICP